MRKGWRISWSAALEPVLTLVLSGAAATGTACSIDERQLVAVASLEVEPFGAGACGVQCDGDQGTEV